MRAKGALAVLLAATAAAQQPAPSPSPRPQRTPPPISFGVEVQYVEVDAIVTDKDGKVVRDLTKDDFEIKEQGQARPVEVAALVDLEMPPIGKRELRPEADVRDNKEPFQGRLYVLVLDDLHTAALRSVGVRRAARRFLEQYFGDDDLGAVVYTSPRGDAGQGLTGSRSLLLAAVDRFLGNRLRSATLNKIDVYNQTRDFRDPNERLKDPEEAQRGYNARGALDTLKGVADWLRMIHGRRKAVVYFSEGLDYDVYDPFNNPDATTILDSLRDAITAATRANVSFYTVDPRGLHAMGDEIMELQAVTDTSLGLDSRGLASEMRLAQDSLRVIADETAGRAAVNTNDFENAFERIVEDNSSYYMLGFRPVNERADGRFRKLEVRVRRPGLVVKARNGYALQREPRRREMPETLQHRTPAVLRQMLSWPMQQNGLPMTVHAAAFKGTAGKAAVLVTVHVAAGAFRYVEKGELSQEVLDLTIAAVDSKEKLGSQDSQIKLELKPRTRQFVDALGFRVVSEIDLLPGRYQLRLLGRAQNAKLSGSVYYDLEVPDFTKGDLVMSGLSLASAAGGLVPGAGTFAPLQEVLTPPPTVFREFFPHDTLTVVAEIYDNKWKTPHTLDVTTAVLEEKGTVRFSSDQQRKTDELAAMGGGSFVHKVVVPLKDLAPGNYTLRVEARSRMGKRESVVRELPFRVAPLPAPKGS
jgi:VWFA-related protein